MAETDKDDGDDDYEQIVECGSNLEANMRWRMKESLRLLREVLKMAEIGETLGYSYYKLLPGDECECLEEALRRGSVNMDADPDVKTLELLGRLPSDQRKWFTGREKKDDE